MKKQPTNKGNGKSDGKLKSNSKKDLSDIKCFNCGEFGHYKNKCPKLKGETASNIEVALMVKVVETAVEMANGNVNAEMDSTSEWLYDGEDYPLYCLACTDFEDSVSIVEVERVLVKNESFEDAKPTTKPSQYELTDNFFDDFESMGPEEFDSESNFDLTETPSWFSVGKEEFFDDFDDFKAIDNEDGDETVNKNDVDYMGTRSGRFVPFDVSVTFVHEPVVPDQVISSQEVIQDATMKLFSVIRCPFGIGGSNDKEDTVVDPEDREVYKKLAFVGGEDKEQIYSGESAASKEKSSRNMRIGW
jgi:Zinc knuckle